MKIILILSMILVCGCISKINYDYSNREVKSITYEGVNGKFVPNIVFESMMNRYIEWEYYNKKYGDIDR